MNIQTIKESKTTRLVMTALFAALTLVATMIIRIPSPTGGYIHPGDALVLLSGYFLGPVYGGLAAAIGSGLTDFLGGYMVYLPATFIIKGLTAFVAAVLLKNLSGKMNEVYSLITAGLVGELVMVFGYFVYEIFILGFSMEGAINIACLKAGFIASLAGVFPNMMQGLFGVLASTICYPLLKKAILKLS